jgi:hypothetical protein
MVNVAKIKQALQDYFWDSNTERPLDENHYRIDDQGRVHVDFADVMVYRKSATGKLPVRFGVVGGDFLVEDMGLDSLEGAPIKVMGRFNCSKNLLTSLQHAPASCVDLDCSHNQLTDFTHAPKVANTITCNNNQLKDLHDCPASSDVFAAYNPFENFRNTPTNIELVTITWHADLPLLGLLTVHHVEIFDADTGEYREDLSKILNAHVSKGASNKAAMLKCAGELIKAGYKDNARW